ncbi:MAG: DUF58 domain-containing protein [Candidatus Xenobiia bacterium LiM19]
MIITTRALLFMLLAGVVMLYVSHQIEAVTAFLVLDGLMAAAVSIDYLMTPHPPVITIRRIVPPLFQCGVENTVRMEVENRSSHSVRITIRDDLPLSFKTSDAPLQVAISPGGKAECAYVAVPVKRGTFHFGAVRIRIDGVLGLVIRQFSSGEKEEVRVVPAITDVLKFQSLASRRSIREAGRRRSLFSGMGTEFESLREYHRDDEYRHINWKASARRTKLIVESFEEDRTETVLMAIDTGRLMRADVAGLERMEYAIVASLLLSHVALERDDRVGMLLFSHKVSRFLPPDKGKKQFQRLFSLCQDVEASGTETDYFSLLEYLDGRHRKRSLVVIFTDFAEEGAAASLLQCIPRMYPRHLPLVVMVRDPALSQASDAYPQDSSTLFRKAVAVDLLSERLKTESALKKQGVLVLDCLPQSLSSSLLRLYVEVKRKGLL